MKVLAINDVHVDDGPVRYTCYGLGSCVGLFVMDRTRNLYGGAHIPLGRSRGGEFMGADWMIAHLLDGFRSRGSDLLTLRAKVTGGANVYEGSGPIGEETHERVVALLTEYKIFIAAKDVGGSLSRTARFDSLTGDLVISTPTPETYSI